MKNWQQQTIMEYKTKAWDLRSLVVTALVENPIEFRLVNILLVEDWLISSTGPPGEVDEHTE